MGMRRIEPRPAPSPRISGGTLACPECDAPVAPAEGGMAPTASLGCPYCGRIGAVRDFLSLAGPSRPARVQVVLAASSRITSRIRAKDSRLSR